MNLNASPYYDDFSEDKQYYQLLFRPGFSVQARELTQLQSILRDQISKFGSHIFKHGSIVIPGNSYYDLNICYVKILDTTYDISTLVGQYITGGTTGLISLIRATTPKTNTDPATIYVSYTNSGTNGEKVFADSEVLTADGVTTTFTTAVSATGAASMAFINKGVYFINGTFATVEQQSAVISKYSATPSCHVVLQISESIVTANDDPTLLDPAQGSYNYAAPGADRLKIDLTLTSVPLNSILTDDYVEIMRFNEGTLELHSKNAQYNELDKSLARRTYDESGDYVVRGLNVTSREHLKSGLNEGRYDPPTGDASKFIYTVGAGKAYIRGFENELIAPYEIAANKARDASHISTSIINLKPSYGQYFYITQVNGMPNISTRVSINLLDNVGGSVIGTAKVLALDYHTAGTSDTMTIFKLYVTDVSINVGKGQGDISALSWTNSDSTTGTAKVCALAKVLVNSGVGFQAPEIVTNNVDGAGTVIKYVASTGELYTWKNSTVTPQIYSGENIQGLTSSTTAKVTSVEILGKNSNDSLLVELPFSSSYRVKDATNTSDISYKIYYHDTVNITGGTGSMTVSGMTIDPLETGNCLFISTVSGVLPISVANLSVDGSSITFTGLDVATSKLFVIVSATKTGVQGSPATKTLVTTTQSGVAMATSVTLAQSDVIRIKKVEAVNISTSAVTDITSKWSFDNGQKDYGYTPGSIKWISTDAQPSNSTLSITYDYFNHNSGDYFCIDSYESSGELNYYDSPILTYTSPNTGKVYDLRNHLDFRKKTGVAGNIVQIDSRITTSMQHYMGRFDAIVMDKGGLVSAIAGTPSDSPVVPTIPNDSLYLYKSYVPPYTFKASDVVLTKQKNRVYTMKDIGKIEDRVEKLEEYVQLNATETSAVNYDIVDAQTGLSRFKSGYLVDTMLNPDTISDITNPKFKVTYNSGTIIPQFEVIEAPLNIKSNPAQITGTALTLPYSEVVFAKQPYSSKIVNINPFAAFNWTGEMTLTPRNDTWTDIAYAPTINLFNTEYVPVRRPWNWVPPAGAFVTYPPAPAPVARGGGGKIICTKLYELGLMSKEVYEADQAFGELMLEKDPAVIHGYHKWAQIVVDWMDGKGPKVFWWLSDEDHAKMAIKWSRSWAYEIATPWAKYMAFEMGIEKKKDTLGSILMSFGKPISRLVNKMSGDKEPGLLAGWSCVAVFTLLYTIVKISKLFKK